MIRIARSTFCCLRTIRFTPATIIFVAVIVLAAFGAIAQTWFARPASTEGSVQSAAQDKPPVSLLEAILITLQPHGFEPAEITRKAGQFLLAVDNRSGVHEPEFRVDRVTGNRVHDKKMAKGRLAWRQLVDLPPGNYVLTEASELGLSDHPNPTMRREARV